MSHELEIVNGKANFAYNIESGTPWHGLGTPVVGLQSAEQMLEIAHANYHVDLRPVFVQNDAGEFIEITDRFATTRVNHDGTLVPFEVMKKRYRVVQNAVVLEKALAVVGASNGDAVIETLGVLKDGRQFFASIDLGSLIIDPVGVNDKIDRFLLVQTSHDGTMPIVYSNTDIRPVCANTCRFGHQMARSTFKARHTPNYEDTLQEAQAVLQISTEWAEAFKARAEELLRIPVPQASQNVDVVLNALWPAADADTDRKERNRDEILTDVRVRFNNNRNAGLVGFNGWGLYNAVTEYLDHGRSGSGIARAMASMDSTSLVSQKKMVAEQAILNLV